MRKILIAVIIAGCLMSAALTAQPSGGVASSARVTQITSRIWLPAAGCDNTTAGAFWDLPATGAAAAACLTGTNAQGGVLDFANGADALSAQMTLALPADMTGAVDAVIRWLSPATTGSVVWQLSTACVAAGESADPAWNTADTVTDAAQGVANRLNTASMTDVTMTGCAAGELLRLKIARDPTTGDDTLADTARLAGVELTLRRRI